MTLTDYMYQEKRKEEDLPAFKDSVDASIQRLEDNIEKHTVGLITATRNDIENTKTNRRQKLENKNGKKNNSMGVLKD